MTEKNGILDYVTKAAERAAKAETFLEAIAVYVSTENYPEKSFILALASMGGVTLDPEEEPKQEDENNGK